MLNITQNITKCHIRFEGNEHDPIHCVKPASNTRVSWFPHGHPFFTELSWTNRFTKHPPSFYMDQIPSTGNYIVVLHLYLHFAFDHTHTYGLHVREAARGVRDLLSRNPSAKVVIRGPHALIWSHGRRHIFGDYHGERSLHIFTLEFQDLVDRVVFLNTWDMTIADQNMGIHPEANREMTRLLFGHVCPAA